MTSLEREKGPDLAPAAFILADPNGDDKIAYAKTKVTLRSRCQCDQRHIASSSILRQTQRSLAVRSGAARCLGDSASAVGSGGSSDAAPGLLLAGAVLAPIYSC